MSQHNKVNSGNFIESVASPGGPAPSPLHPSSRSRSGTSPQESPQDDARRLPPRPSMLTSLGNPSSSSSNSVGSPSSPGRDSTSGFSNRGNPQSANTSTGSAHHVTSANTSSGAGVTFIQPQSPGGPGASGDGLILSAPPGSGMLGSNAGSNSNFMVSAQSTVFGAGAAAAAAGDSAPSSTTPGKSPQQSSHSNVVRHERSSGPNSNANSHSHLGGGGDDRNPKSTGSLASGGGGSSQGTRTCRVGEYELGRDLGTGATAHVRMARHIPSGTAYAAKIIPRGNPEEEESLKREVRALSKIDHEHVIKYRQLLLSQHNFYVIMEAALGGDLLTLLLQREQGLPVPEVRRLFTQLVRGLTACHMAKVAHRDLKPDNILISTENNIKLSDFGVCRFHNGRHRAKPDEYSHTFVGTIEYAAPEVVRGDSYDGFRADMWSLGCVLHAMLSGRFPFGFQPTRQDLTEAICSGDYVKLPAGTDPAAVDLVAKLIVSDPGRRLTCVEVLNHDFILGRSGTSSTSTAAPSPMSNRHSPAIAQLPGGQQQPQRGANTSPSQLPVPGGQHHHHHSSSSKSHGGSSNNMRSSQDSDGSRGSNSRTPFEEHQVHSFVGGNSGGASSSFEARLVAQHNPPVVQSVQSRHSSANGEGLPNFSFSKASHASANGSVSPPSPLMPSVPPPYANSSDRDSYGQHGGRQFSSSLGTGGGSFSSTPNGALSNTVVGGGRSPHQQQQGNGGATAAGRGGLQIANFRTSMSSGGGGSGVQNYSMSSAPPGSGSED